MGSLREDEENDKGRLMIIPTKQSQLDLFGQEED